MKIQLLIKPSNSAMFKVISLIKDISGNIVEIDRRNLPELNEALAVPMRIVAE